MITKNTLILSETFSRIVALGTLIRQIAQAKAAEAQSNGMTLTPLRPDALTILTQEAKFFSEDEATEDALKIAISKLVQGGVQPRQGKPGFDTLFGPIVLDDEAIAYIEEQANAGTVA